MITERHGDQSDFFLDIEEATSSGKMVWPVLQECNIVNTTKSDNEAVIYTWIKQNFFNIRCKISGIEINGETLLVIHAATTTRNYKLSKNDLEAFKQYVTNLKVPISKGTEIDFKIQLINDTKKTHIGIMAFKHHVKDAELKFKKVMIDGDEYPTFPQNEIGANQGIYLPLGRFKNGSKLKIDWVLESGFDTDYGTQVGIAIFRNWDFRNNTLIDSFPVRALEEYAGSTEDFEI